MNTHKSLFQQMEVKIPPPVVTVTAGLLMWGLAQLFPALVVTIPMRETIASALALPGFAVAFSGFLAFNRVKTTVNPLHPERVSSLVTSGIYRFTRNPMYVGLLLVLIAWGVLLSTPLSLIGLVVFVSYLTRFQIQPEERALAAKFGAAYEAYRQKVRRWL